MKSTIFFNDYWNDPETIGLTIEQRILGAYLWANSSLNVSGLYKISDDIIRVETGLSQESLDEARIKLEEINRAHFLGYWVYLPNFQRQNGYINSKQQVSIEKNLAKVPQEVLNHFRSFGYEIPYGYPINSPINNKPYNISDKSETKVISQEDKSWDTGCFNDP